MKEANTSAYIDMARELAIQHVQSVSHTMLDAHDAIHLSLNYTMQFVAEIAVQLAIMNERAEKSVVQPCTKKEM